ncbi:MAG: Ig-like domain-containing protein [Candidatus Saganbacteria bacterium]|nr:Ig-like domain-containing protein [Candidatus Saganbacteria bacterium]
MISLSKFNKFILLASIFFIMMLLSGCIVTSEQWYTWDEEGNSQASQKVAGGLAFARMAPLVSSNTSGYVVFNYNYSGCAVNLSSSPIYHVLAIQIPTADVAIKGTSTMTSSNTSPGYTLTFHEDTDIATSAQNNIGSPASGYQWIGLISYQSYSGVIDATDTGVGTLYFIAAAEKIFHFHIRWGYTTVSNPTASDIVWLDSGYTTQNCYVDGQDPYPSLFLVQDPSTLSSTYTNSQNVKLNIGEIDPSPASPNTPSGTTKMRFSNDNSSWSGWTNYSTPYANWPLSSGDGTKTVYVQLKDFAGNISTSYSDTIVFDTQDPTTSHSLSGTSGTGGSYASDVSVTLSASDATSGVNTTKYKIDTGSWTTYTGAFTVSSSCTVHYYSIDNAGNDEAEKSVSITIDKTPATPSPDDYITSWSNSTSRTFYWTAIPSASGYYCSIDNSAPEASPNQWVTSPQATFTVPEGTHTFYVKAYNAGFLSSNGTHPVYVDTTPPTISGVSRSPSTPTVAAGTYITVNATITDTNGISYAGLYYRIGNTGGYSPVTMTTGCGGGGDYSAQIPASAVTPAGVQYYIYARDPAGNYSTYSCDPITVPDTVGPVITGITASGITTTSATITWTTDELSDSRVDYGLTAPSGTTVSDSTMTTSHSITLTGLTDSKAYHYTVTSKDGSSNHNSSTSSENTLLTLDLIAPVVDHTQVSSPRAAGANITMYATCTDNSGLIPTVILYYRYKTSPTPPWTTQTMVVAADCGGGYEKHAGMIPGTDVTQAGDIEYYIKATDASLNETSTPTYTITITPASLDHITVDPASRVFSAGETPGGTQQFTAHAYDAYNNAISGLTLSWSTTGGGSVNASGLFTVNTQAGNYTVSVSSGGKSATATVTVPDVVGPAITITYPADKSVVNSNPITVTGTASDNQSVSKVEVRVNGGAWSLATGTTSWSRPVNLTPGPNIIDIKATDGQGNANCKTITISYF